MNEIESPNQVQENLIKIIIVGDSNTGKTCILHRYVSNAFTETVPTIGAAFAEQTVTLNGTDFKLNIWDTAGQETYRNLIPMYYRGADVAIIVFDLTNEKTFNSIDFWVESVKQNCGENCICLLCGNKSDLDTLRVVSDEKIQQLSEDLQVTFFLTSAVSGVNIQKMFEFCVSEYIRTSYKTQTIDENANIVKKENNSRCC